MTVYPDSSFILPLYLADAHSPDARRRMAIRPLVYLTPFHQAEVANAMFQHVFRLQASLQEIGLAYANFERDCAAGLWVLTAQPERAFQVSAELAQRHVATLGVRTLDSLHVAAALELKADVFWTFDERQKRLAEVEGLATA